jgi:hypothetical protein
MFAGSLMGSSGRAVERCHQVGGLAKSIVGFDPVIGQQFIVTAALFWSPPRSATVL